MRAGSKHKYLRIHTGTHDAPYYFTPAMNMQLSFFDCWLKDDDYGGWKTGKQAPVSFAVRKGDPGISVTDEKTDFKYRNEQEWPLARTVYQKVNLTLDKQLGAALQPGDGVLSYTALQ